MFFPSDRRSQRRLLILNEAEKKISLSMKAVGAGDRGRTGGRRGAEEEKYAERQSLRKYRLLAPLFFMLKNRQDVREICNYLFVRSLDFVCRF